MTITVFILHENLSQMLLRPIITKGCFVFISLLITAFPALADKEKPWFSSSKMFPTLVFNPMETQVSGIIGVLLSDDELSYDLFCPVAIGFHKAIYSTEKYSISLNGLIHSQFGWRAVGCFRTRRGDGDFIRLQWLTLQDAPRAMVVRDLNRHMTWRRTACDNRFLIAVLVDDAQLAAQVHVEPGIELALADLPVAEVPSDLR